jgi:hypothetical protein
MYLHIVIYVTKKFRPFPKDNFCMKFLNWDSRIKQEQAGAALWLSEA